MAEPVHDLPPYVASLLTRLGGDRVAPDGGLPAPLLRIGAPWPKPLGPALRGPVGELVAVYGEHTEADPAALVGTYLAMFGSAAGRGPHALVGETRHGANLNVLLLGLSAKSRKGTSKAIVYHVMKGADPAWATGCVASGLSTGEGLIDRICDRIEGVDKKGEAIVVHPGTEDKRVTIVEEEFTQVLRVARREGNTLSPVLRQAWDGADLHTLTKTSKATATDPHVSVVGHAVKDEFLRHLDSAEIAGGSVNRFLPFCVKRARELPEGGRPDPAAVEGLVRRTERALAFARAAGRVERDGEAREVWAAVYGDLSAERPGLLGTVTARAEAQVLRLSLLYALLDRSKAIAAEHLLAALDVWDFCFASAAYLFGDATGDPTADRILRELRAGTPLSQNDLLVDVFGRNVKAAEIHRATERLESFGLISCRTEDTEGRPRTVWAATS